MSIDPYSPCPGGTGKKVKFCCQDLLNELGKVESQMAGGQLAACMDNVKQLDEKYPDRPCLLSYKFLLGWLNRQPDMVNDSLERFSAKFPDNPIARANRAMALAQNGTMLPAIHALQDAFDVCGDEMPSRVYDAITLLSQALFGSGHVLPARGLLTLLMIISRGQDQTVMRMLMELENSQHVPMLFKDVPGFRECAKDALYRKPFEGALRNAGRGAWRAAERAWAEMLKQNEEDPAIWKNLAIVRGYLADYQGAAEAWRKFAGLDVPQDEEIEAEATAQLLGRDKAEGEVDDLTVTVPLTDYEAFESALENSRMAERKPVDPGQYAEQGVPPPRAIFAIFDKPRLDAAPNISRQQIPLILAQANLYGKETDREARVQIDLYRTHLDSVLATLRSLGGGALGNSVEEEIFGKVSALELALSWQWRLPEKTGWKERVRLLREQREHILVNIWPTLRLPLLDNLTPDEAAADWNMRDRLQAAIMLLEMTDASDAAQGLFVKLRERLSLPPAEKLTPDKIDLKTARLPRFLHLDLEKFDDEQLKKCFERVMVAQFMPAARQLAKEILRRPQLGPVEFRLSAYSVLVRVTEDADEALGYVEAARNLAEKNKQTTAPWDLEELTLRIIRQESAEVGKLIEHLSRAHMKEQGVPEALFQILAKAGMVGPNGEMLVPGGGPATAPSPIITSPEGNSGEGKLWTPDGATGGEKKSSLWIPD